VLLIACGSVYDSTPRNSELVVRYNGKKVHHVGAEWASHSVLRAALDRPGKKYLVFGAPWCAPCVHLKKLLRQEGVGHKVIYLNIDETWAFLLSRNLGVKGVPSMVEVDGVTASRSRFGTNNILVYLLAHLDPS